MWIFKKLFEWLAKFFGSKAGKTTAKVMAGVGIAAGGAAAGEMIVAHKRNKRAERIKAAALKKHDEGRVKVEATLADLGETKMEIYKSFGELQMQSKASSSVPNTNCPSKVLSYPALNPQSLSSWQWQLKLQQAALVALPLVVLLVLRQWVLAQFSRWHRAHCLAASFFVPWVQKCFTVQQRR